MGRANVSKKSFVYNVDMAFVIDATLSMDDLLDVAELVQVRQENEARAMEARA